jgi:bifunctional non-homologous end joining protein LigD
MTELLPELRAIPACGVFDGELISLDWRGRPSFQRGCRRLLQRDSSVAISFVVFDVLELDGEATMRLPYRERRERLESLAFGGACEVGPRFDDGSALWQAIREHRLEGVVAKRDSEPYRPGERTWIKRKNPEWPRFEAERESAIRERQRRPHLTV